MSAPQLTPVRYLEKRTSWTARTTAPMTLRVGLAPRASSSSAQATSAPPPNAWSDAVRSAPNTPVHPTTTVTSQTTSAGFGHWARITVPSLSRIHH